MILSLRNRIIIYCSTWILPIPCLKQMRLSFSKVSFNNWVNLTCFSSQAVFTIRFMIKEFQMLDSVFWLMMCWEPRMFSWDREAKPRPKHTFVPLRRNTLPCRDEKSISKSNRQFDIFDNRTLKSMFLIDNNNFVFVRKKYLFISQCWKDSK